MCGMQIAAIPHKMQFLDKRARQLRIGWGKRSLTEDDFHRLCRRFKVSVIEMPLVSGGFYYRVKGRDYIAVDSRLSGIPKRKVLFHELAHFLFHAPESGATANFLNLGGKTKVENEADAFALCAVIPKAWFLERSMEEVLETEDITVEDMTTRLGLYLTYDI
jgi:Zn-dependent peptidase ImmA (M78 family)